MDLRQLCAQWLVSLPWWARHARHLPGVTLDMVTDVFLLPRLERTHTADGVLLAPAERECVLESLMEQQGAIEMHLDLLVGVLLEALQEARRRKVAIPEAVLADQLARSLWVLDTPTRPLTDMELEVVASTYLSNCQTEDAEQTP